MTRRLTILAALALGILPASARPGDAPEAEARAPANAEAPPLADPADSFDGIDPGTPPAPAPSTDDPPPKSKLKLTSKPGTPANPPQPIEIAPLDLPSRPADAKRDEDVEPAQTPPAAPADEVNPLGPAKETPGQPTPTTDAPAPDPFVLRADQVKAGPNAVALSVEVQAPTTFNVQLPMTLQFHVRNTGKGDAFGVRVRYALADGLEYLDSEPKETRRDGPLLYWQLETLPKGNERVIKVRVRPTTVGNFDHAATVSLMTGGRASTLVKKPELKLEMAASPTPRVLRGQPVLFTINITNPGTGPARDVVLKAHLSPGLKHDAGQEIELPLADLGRKTLGPGEHEVVELEVGSVVEGEQSCEVVAASSDVPAPATARQAVTIVEPKLSLKLNGPTLRFPDTVAVYQLTVVNPGTAVARKVRIFANVPSGGRLESLPEGATWDRSNRWLSWKLAELEPNRPVVLSFAVKMGGIQFYKVEAQADAAGDLKVNEHFSTSVTGMPDVRFTISEPRRVIDVGQATTFEVRVKNHGTKEAGHLNLKGKVSEHLQIEEVTGADGSSHPGSPQAPTDFDFPTIERLAAGAEQVLTVRVKGLKKGFATCHLTLTYDGTIQEGPIQIDQTAPVRVTDAAEAR
jgi:uncharacterized repeat protein (TIGR01451 family)